MNKYILQTFCCNLKLQNAATIWGVLASVFSSILLITTLSTQVFMDRIFADDNHYPHYYYTTTPLYWIIVIGSTVHIIVSIFLAIGAEKKNEYMLMPWIVVQAMTFAVFIPIIFSVLLCAVIVSFPVYIWWAVHSLFVTLKIEKMEAAETRDAPASRATAPSPTDLYPLCSNTFVDVQLPTYNDVVPDGSTDRSKV